MLKPHQPVSNKRIGSNSMWNANFKRYNFIHNSDKKLKSLFSLILRRYASNFFILCSFLLIFLTILVRQDESHISPYQLDLTISLVLFLAYILPLLLEVLLRIVELLIEYKAYVARAKEKTQIQYSRFKHFRKTDLGMLDPTPGLQAVKPQRSFSVRSAQNIHIESSQNLQDIVLTSNLEETAYSNLRIGDIIVLNRNQQSPGDLLILDMSDRFGFFYSKDFDTCGVIQKKEAAKSTKVECHAPNKGDLNYLRRIYRGTFTYAFPYSHDEFEGHIKLSKDPKGEPVTSQNILYYGQTVQYNKWVIGMLIRVGSQSLYHRQLSVIPQKASQKQTYLPISVLSIIFYLVIPICVSLIQYLYFQDSSDGTSYLEIQLRCFAQFLIIYPSYMNLILYLVEVLPLFRIPSKQLIELKDELIPEREQIKKPSQTNYAAIHDIMKTSHVFLNVQILQESKVEAICHADIIYLLDEHQIQNALNTAIPKESQFYLNLVRTANDQYNELFQEKINPILTNTAPEKLSIASHLTQSKSPIIKKSVIANSPIKARLESRPLPNVHNSMDAAISNHCQNPPNPIHLISQASQDPDEEVTNKQLQILKEAQLIDLGQQHPFHYFELFVIVSLCHLTRSEFTVAYPPSRASKNHLMSEFEQRRPKFKIQQYFLAEDEALLKLSKLFRFQYRAYGYNRMEQLCYILKLYELEVSYVIQYRLYHQGLSQLDENKSTNTQFCRIPSRFIAIIIEDSNFIVASKVCSILLCRFCISSLFDIPGHEKFDLVRKAQLQKQIQFLINKGNQIVCYTRLELKQPQSYQNKSLIINDEEETAKIIELLQFNHYEIVGLFGIGQPEFEELQRESFINTRTRLIIQSEKPYELVLPYCMKNQILTFESNVYNFQSPVRDDIIYQFRQIISSINSEEHKKSSSVLKRSMTAQYDKIKSSQSTLVMDGNVFQIILRDKHLRTHFGFIVHFNKILVFYNLSPKLRVDLLCFMKKYDTEYLQSLCINYYIHGSYGQVKSCDYALQRHSDPDQSVFGFINKYNISEEDLEIFDNLTLKNCFQIYQIMDAFKRAMLMSNFTFAIVLFILYSNQRFYGQFAWTNNLLVQQLLVPLVAIFIITKTILTEQEYLRVKLSIIKCRSLNFKGQQSLGVFLESIIDATIIICAFYMLRPHTSEHQFGAYVILFTIKIIVFFFKLAFSTIKDYLKLFFLLIIVLLILIYLVISMIQIEYEYINDFFNEPDIIMTIVLVILVKLAVERASGISIYKYKHILERNFFDIEFHIIIETLSKYMNPQKTVQSLIKKLFKDAEMDMSIKNIVNKQDKNQAQVQLSYFTLNFQLSIFQQEFIRSYTTQWRFLGSITNLSYFLGLDIYLLIHYSVYFNDIEPWYYGIMIFLTVAQFVLINQYFVPKFWKYLIHCGMLQTVFRLLTISMEMGNMENSEFVPFLFYFLLILSLNQQVNYQYLMIILQQIVLLIIGIIMIYVSNNNSITRLEKGEIIVLLLTSIIISIYCRYQDDLTQREDFICTKELDIERQKYQQVMSLLLPSFVLGRLVQGNVNFSENQGLVGILFVDFCYFDKIVSEEKQNIVELIDRIYRAFDQLCSSTNCQKIETVGKTYMACAGLQCVEKFQSKNHFKNPIERLVELAFGIQSEIVNFKWGSNKPFTLKIGMHYGRVLMGVIGSIKPQFSLIGDTVNTASRMCALCPEGRIQISQQAYDQIHKVKYVLFTPNQIEAKGKGLMDTYLVDRKRNFDTSFALRKKDSSIQIDEKIKFVLINQGSFHNKDKPPQSKQSMRQMTLRNINANKLHKQQPQEESNLISLLNQPVITSQLNTPKPQAKPQPPLASFAAAQMQLLRKQTKRNIMAQQGPQMPTQTQITAQQAPQIAQGSNPTPHQNHGVSNTSLKFIPQKSLFSHYQTGEQPQTVNRQQSEDIFSPKADRKQSGVDLNLNIQPMEQSIQLQDSQRFGDESPMRCRVNNDEETKRLQQGETNQKIIKFGDSELLIKIQKEIQNKAIPLFKVQELFMEKKLTLVSDDDKMKISIDLVKESMRKSDKVTQYYDMQLIYGKNSLIISLVLSLLINLMFLLLSQIENTNIRQAIIRSVVSIFQIIPLYLLKSQIFQWSRLKFVCIIVSQLVICSINFGVYFTNDQNGVVLAIETVTKSSLLLTHKWLYFQEKILIAAFMFVTWLVIASSIFVIQVWDTLFILISMLLFLERELLSFLSNYNQMLHSLQIEEKQQEKINLLSCLLPVHVLSKFLDDQSQQKSFSDAYNECTILFADIAGFTKYSSSVQPEEVVSMLKNLFDEFDKLTQIHNVFKLYTIGDCYVVIGVTDNLKRDPVQEAFNVVEMGLNMLEAINLVRNQINYHDLHMRIGIHTGNVIGGIIGTDIIRYDVYGKDILIANKMESSSEEGRVLVSETTKKILEEHYQNYYNFTGRKLINIPSINTIITGYFLDFEG